MRDRIRFVLYLYGTDQDLACLPVSDVAAAAERAGSSTACVMTNGRFSGAARATAEEQNVPALHCSRIDRLSPQPKTIAAAHSDRRTGLPRAA